MGLDDSYGDALDPVDEDGVVDRHPVREDSIEPGTRDAIRDVLERQDDPVSAYTLRTKGGYEHAHPIGAAYRLGDDLRAMQEEGEIVKVDSRHYVPLPVDVGGEPERFRPLAADTTPGTPAAIHDVLAWMEVRLDRPVHSDAIRAAAGYSDADRLTRHLEEMEDAGEIEEDSSRYILSDR